MTSLAQVEFEESPERHGPTAQAPAPCLRRTTVYEGFGFGSADVMNLANLLPGLLLRWAETVDLAKAAVYLRITTIGADLEIAFDVDGGPNFVPLRISARRAAMSSEIRYPESVYATLSPARMHAQIAEPFGLRTGVP